MMNHHSLSLSEFLSQNIDQIDIDPESFIVRDKSTKKNIYVRSESTSFPEQRLLHKFQAIHKRIRHIEWNLKFCEIFLTKQFGSHLRGDITVYKKLLQCAPSLIIVSFEILISTLVVHVHYACIQNNPFECTKAIMRESYTQTDERDIQVETITRTYVNSTGALLIWMLIRNLYR